MARRRTGIILLIGSVSSLEGLREESTGEAEGPREARVRFDLERFV